MTPALGRARAPGLDADVLGGMTLRIGREQHAALPRAAVRIRCTRLARAVRPRHLRRGRWPAAVARGHERPVTSILRRVRFAALLRRRPRLALRLCLDDVLVVLRTGPVSDERIRRPDRARPITCARKHDDESPDRAVHLRRVYARPPHPAPRASRFCRPARQIRRASREAREVVRLLAANDRTPRRRDAAHRPRRRAALPRRRALAPHARLARGRRDALVRVRPTMTPERTSTDAPRHPRIAAIACARSSLPWPGPPTQRITPVASTTKVTGISETRKRPARIWPRSCTIGNVKP